MYREDFLARSILYIVTWWQPFVLSVGSGNYSFEKGLEHELKVNCVAQGKGKSINTMSIRLNVLLPGVLRMSPSVPAVDTADEEKSDVNLYFSYTMGIGVFLISVYVGLFCGGQDHFLEAASDNKQGYSRCENCANSACMG
ncbi:hypothetical protein BJ741DRAFT_584532 [Chytriomyces cf. hyalinus JEL632]|nr:hypothetical protein BJ741DRAFT_584532 [Chytriomyces cf. hyalinus JEL632]